MTPILRDYFAIHCPEKIKDMTWTEVKKGLGLAHDLDIKYWTDDMTLLCNAKKRYRYADAMLAARSMPNE